MSLTGSCEGENGYNETATPYMPAQKVHAEEHGNIFLEHELEFETWALWVADKVPRFNLVATEVHQMLKSKENLKLWKTNLLQVCVMIRRYNTGKLILRKRDRRKGGERERERASGDCIMWQEDSRELSSSLNVFGWLKNLASQNQQEKRI